jgi:hypothetical protein
MQMLATKLHGYTNYDELASHDQAEARMVKRILAAVIGIAIEDLMHEVENGYDLKSEGRYYENGYQRYPKELPRRLKGSVGRRAIPLLSPYAFIFGESEEDLSFNWICRSIGLDPGYTKNGIKQKILKKFINFVWT